MEVNQLSKILNDSNRNEKIITEYVKIYTGMIIDSSVVEQ